MLEEASEDTELGIDRGGGQTGGLRSSDKISDVLGRRPRDIIRQHHLAAPREMTEQHVEGRDHRAQGRVGILTGGESGKVTQDAVLIRPTEARERQYTSVHFSRPYPVRTNSNSTNCCVEKDLCACRRRV